jgi:excisionase family DNA binding protein
VSVRKRTGVGILQETEMKDVYTTGEAARLLCVAPRTVCKWFDSGRLKGFRVPGSQDRCIPREQLVRFITDHGLALPAELTDEVDEDVGEDVSDKEEGVS